MSALSADAIAIAFSILLLAGYYIFLASRVRHDPAYTIHAVNQRARLLWVQEVMRHGNKDIMAIQALRNYVMSATFMASSSVLLIIGTLTLSGQADGLAKNWHVLSAAEPQSTEWWIVKVLCLLTTLIVAFFAFAMTLRILNHVVFMVSLGMQDAVGNLSPEKVAQRLNRAGYFYSLGMRGFFLTVPLVFWLFGPVFLVVATIGLVILLYRIDRAPGG